MADRDDGHLELFTVEEEEGVGAVRHHLLLLQGEQPGVQGHPGPEPGSGVVVVKGLVVILGCSLENRKQVLKEEVTRTCTWALWRG